MHRTKLFRVASIVMLVVGVIGLVTTGSQILYLVEYRVGQADGSAISDVISESGFIFSVVFALAGAGLRLAAGLVGLRAKDSRNKYYACLALCLLIFAITLVVKLIDLIAIFNLSMLIGVLIGLLIPTLYLIGLLKSRGEE